MNEQVAPKNMPPKKKVKVNFDEFSYCFTHSNLEMVRWPELMQFLRDWYCGLQFAFLHGCECCTLPTVPKQQNPESWKLSSQESLPFTNFVHSFPPKPQTRPQALAFGRLTLSKGTLTTFQDSILSLLPATLFLQSRL